MVKKKKEQSRIPTGKVKRASKFISTGAKVGGNYVKHYTKKIFKPDLEKVELDKKNASDIYSALSNLKGSALKIAQMMSMNNALPKAVKNPDYQSIGAFSFSSSNQFVTMLILCESADFF